MPATTTPRLALTRIFNAPRALVYQAFTDPDQFVEWWGPLGNSLPRDEIDFDVRPGGHQRWTEVLAAEPDARVHIHVGLTDVADGEPLDGINGRTRVEVGQWLPEHLASPSEQGWLEAFAELDATLAEGL
jgi:uncharacterized protein YndB with AHSA1/START domain